MAEAGAADCSGAAKAACVWSRALPSCWACVTLMSFTVLHVTSPLPFLLMECADSHAWPQGQCEDLPVSRLLSQGSQLFDLALWASPALCSAWSVGSCEWAGPPLGRVRETLAWVLQGPGFLALTFPDVPDIIILWETAACMWCRVWIECSCEIHIYEMSRGIQSSLTFFYSESYLNCFLCIYFCYHRDCTIQIKK